MTDFTGNVLGSYKLLELVGSGGFANVYKAVHIWLNTPVAVKVLNLRVNPRDREAASRCLQEALIANFLRHRHIIQILDCNVQDGIPYIVMPYMQNGSLQRVFGENARLPWETIVDYVRQVSEALAFIHSRHLIHQDVKPENMLLADDGTILLGDFGTVAFIESTGTRHPHALAGTIGYMAPERFTNGELTPASDIYSLAIVVYKWLTGRLPFSGTQQEVMYKHLHALPPTRPLSSARIEPAVQRVLLKALAKNPADRYQSALEFHYALNNAMGAYKKKPRRRRPRQIIHGRLSRWEEMPIIFAACAFVSLIPAAICYTRGLQIGTDILVWQLCQSLLSLLTALIRKNWLALGFVSTTFTLAALIAVYAQTWSVFYLSLTFLLLASASIGFLAGKRR